MDPKVIIRAGSHAEKEYFYALAKFMDGVSVGANLFEATPGATASLLLKVGAKNTLFYIDPMTYAYGAYADPNGGGVRSDLDWIKSDQKRKDEHGNKIPVRDFKRSYKKLAAAIGGPLQTAISDGAAITPNTIQTDDDKKKFCRSVAEYQLNRVKREFEENKELKDFAADAPTPAAIFAPYFYVEPSDTDSWFELNLSLMKTTAALDLSVPTHGVVCADKSHLVDAAFRARLVDEIPDTGIAGVWLWFSGFFEDKDSQTTLEGYRDLIEALHAKKIEVYAMRGGYLSLALSKFGLSGIGHGVGYGEQKGVVPIVGQSVPTVQYYLPATHIRLSVADIQRAMPDLEIKTVADFHEKVCDCAVCKGVVVKSLDEFSVFGDKYLSRPDATRKSQTPAAAKRCRYHFLLSRMRERDEIRKQSLKAVVGDLKTARDSWGSHVALKPRSAHLQRWVDVLGKPLAQADND